MVTSGYTSEHLHQIKSGPRIRSKWVEAQPKPPGSQVKDRRGSAGKHQVFDKKDMEEVVPAKTRNLSPSGKEHAARVRAKGACETCKRAKRKVIRSSLICRIFVGRS